LLAPLFPARAADSPIVTFDGDNLHISSLGLHFLQGKSLNRLKGGSTVEYVATVGLFRDQFVTQFKRVEEHFFVSYDVWGTSDAFTVTTGPPVSRASNLSLSATETWCMERLIVGTAGIAPDRQFWLQLDLRTVPPKLTPVLGPSGVYVNIIEAVTPAQDERQSFRTGMLRLEDLVRTPRRGRQG
jgi:hypothetical protein